MYTVFLHACICDSVRKPLYLIFASSSILLSPLFHHCRHPFIVHRVIVHPQWPSFPCSAALSKLRASYMAVHVLQLYLLFCVCVYVVHGQQGNHFIGLGTRTVWCLSTVYRFISWLDVVRTKLIHRRLRQFLHNVWSTWKISELGAALHCCVSTVKHRGIAGGFVAMRFTLAPGSFLACDQKFWNGGSGEGEPCASVRLPWLWDWKSHVWVPIVARHFFLKCAQTLSRFSNIVLFINSSMGHSSVCYWFLLQLLCGM